MIKHVKKHLLLSMVLFSLLLISCLYSALAPPVYAAEPSIQDKTMAILDEVIGLNTEEYATSLNSLIDNQYLSLPQKEVDITLASAEGGLRVSCSFVNNNLRQIYLSDFEGKLSEEKPAADTVEMTGGFLENYQNYAGESFYGELASMLDNVDATKNTTKSAGNIRLNVLNLNQNIVEYVWRYTDENGIVARSKNVILSYDKGQLKLFLNNWPLYKVAGTPKISGKEATEIALEASKTFSYKVSTKNDTSTITGFEIAPDSLGHEVLSYLNFPNQTLARGGDPFTLYPSWYVPVGFNQSYPGAVTGMTVTVWADTGEVSNTNPMVVNFASVTSADEEAIKGGFNQGSTIAVPIVVIALFSVFGVALVRRKKIFTFAGSRKLFPRFWGTLMCGILMFTVVLASTSQVSAIVDPDSKAEIYAAYDTTPAQHPDEINAAEWVCNEAKVAFQASGYNASNLAGEDTIKEDILDNAEYDEDNFYRVAVFHFGHQHSPNFAYKDNENTPIYWSDLQAHIDSDKHVFVFMWVCEQARGPHYGIPANWTNKKTMNPDGYSSPDGDGQCYIGFNGFSPMISLTNGTSFENQTTGAVKYFIQYFYNYALKDSYSVRDALNKATLDFFGDTFPSSILSEGYSAFYSAYDDEQFDRGYYDGKMEVFGDGTVVLFQPKITISAGPGGYVNPAGTHWYTYGERAMAAAHAYDHYIFSHWNLDGQYHSSSQVATVMMYSNHDLLQAIFVQYDYRLTISESSGGTTSPSPGDHWYDGGTPVQVTANNYTNYDFDHWSLDGNTYYQNPITVTMNSNHNLQAIFTYNPPPPEEYQLTVNAYFQGSPLEFGLYIDDEYVGTTMDTYTVTEGTHTLEVPDEFEPYLSFDYWDGCSSSNNPTTVEVYSSKTVTAYYTFW